MLFKSTLFLISLISYVYSYDLFHTTNAYEDLYSDNDLTCDAEIKPYIIKNTALYTDSKCSMILYMLNFNSTWEEKYVISLPDIASDLHIITNITNEKNWINKRYSVNTILKTPKFSCNIENTYKFPKNNYIIIFCGGYLLCMLLYKGVYNSMSYICRT